MGRGITGRRAFRAFEVALVAALVVSCAGCMPWLFTIGDSQTSISTPAIQTTLQPIDSQNRAQGHPGCGLYVDPACDPTYDLHADVENQLTGGTPKWVVVEFGTNDAFFQSYDELAANYASKVEEFDSWWPDSVHFFWVNVAYAPCCTDIDAKVDAINAALDQVAASDPRVTVIDLHSAFIDHLSDWFGGDGLHYNAVGQQAYADLVCQAVGEWADSPNIDQCPPVPMAPTTTTTSTTSTTVPDTTTSVPDTTTSVPDTTTSVPDSTTSVPDTTTSVPDTTTSVPDTTTSVPDTTTG